MFHPNAFHSLFPQPTSGRSLGRRNLIATLSLGALFPALLLLSACSINASDKHNSKDGEAHVDIKSPMGDLHVSEQADLHDAGLSLYPGAKPAPKDDTDDNKSANVNLSLPGFSLKVVAAEFTSDDSTDKIVAYYGKELQKYGRPIQCKGAWGGGAHINKSAGDTNKENDANKPVSCNSEERGDSVELKVGTEGNQHVVSVKPNPHGSRFALVYVRMHTGSDTAI